MIHTTCLRRACTCKPLTLLHLPLALHCSPRHGAALDAITPLLRALSLAPCVPNIHHSGVAGRPVCGAISESQNDRGFISEPSFKTRVSFFKNQIRFLKTGIPFFENRIRFLKTGIPFFDSKIRFSKTGSAF